MTNPTSAPEPGSAVRELADDPASRRNFLRLAGVGSVGALATLISACGGDDESSSTSTTSSTASETPAASGSGMEDMDMEGDIKIVNYALTLEYLEADFYDQVINSGLVKDKKLVELAKTIGEHENQHVEALKSTVESLGGTAAKKPETAFQAVLDKGLKTVLETAATVENLGAAAYYGQAGNIKNKEILAAALSIHSVEARHAAALNQLVGRGFKGKSALEGSIPDGAFAKPMSEEEVLEAVKPFLA